MYCFYWLKKERNTHFEQRLIGAPRPGIRVVVCLVQTLLKRSNMVAPTPKYDWNSLKFYKYRLQLIIMDDYNVTVGAKMILNVRNIGI